MTANLIETHVPWPTPGTLVKRLHYADHSPVRRVATGRRHFATGSYLSVKNGYGVAWESKMELLAFHHAEVATNVVNYYPQPHTWVVQTEGDQFRYTPDLALHRADGRIEVLEVKREYDELEDPRYTAKLRFAAQLCRQAGWSFRLVTRRELEAAPLHDAVDTIQAARRTSVTSADVAIATELCARGRDVALDAFLAAYADRNTGLKKACALVVRRILEIDLSAGLNADARVSLVAGGSAIHG